jgi:FKBP-type peptidyl-prolyl cis-trans isomerase
MINRHQAPPGTCHLAYRHEGIPSLIPPHAVLIVELWLREID